MQTCQPPGWGNCISDPGALVSQPPRAALAYLCQKWLSLPSGTPAQPLVTVESLSGTVRGLHSPSPFHGSSDALFQAICPPSPAGFLSAGGEAGESPASTLFLAAEPIRQPVKTYGLTIQNGHGFKLSSSLSCATSKALAAALDSEEPNGKLPALDRFCCA